MAVADGSRGYTPPAWLARFEADLAALPFLFAAPGDYVVVPQPPDSEWLSDVARFHGPMPRFVAMDELVGLVRSGVLPRFEPRPWGWSPRMAKVFGRLAADAGSPSPWGFNCRWSPRHDALYGRAAALPVLRRCLAALSPADDRLLEPDRLPVAVASVPEAQELLRRWGRVVYKAAHSASGHGLLMLSGGAFNASNRAWARGQIGRGGYLMAEPWADIVAEFSMQFDLAADGCRFRAFGAFAADRKGYYGGNYVGSAPVPRPVADALPAGRLARVAAALADAVASSGLAEVYRGPLGVDMYLYRGGDGALRLNPCSEINVRRNMGLVADCLAGWLHPSSSGFFSIEGGPLSGLARPQVADGKLLAGSVVVAGRNGGGLRAVLRVAPPAPGSVLLPLGRLPGL